MLEIAGWKLEIEASPDSEMKKPPTSNFQ
jgi:hypothetical protein